MVIKPYNRDKLLSGIVNNVKDILKERDVTQAQLVKLLQESGYEISQPDVSKILAGKIKPTVYFLVAVSEVFGVSMEQLVGNVQSEAPLRIEGKNFHLNPYEEEEYNSVLGEYYLYFETTNKLEDSVLMKGNISFHKKDTFCEASMALAVMQNGKHIVKKYSGQLILSNRMQAGYVLLFSPRIGEISFFTFRYRSSLPRPMTCRLGIAVTMSSGEQNLPTAHRLLLSRSELNETHLKKVWPYLKLASNELLVDDEAFCEMMRLHPEKENYLKNIYDISKKRICVRIDEADIRKANRKISYREFTQLKQILLQTAEVMPNTRISEEDDMGALYMLEDEY